MDFWSKIRDLFEEGENSTPSKPLIHEVIKRSEKDLVEYESWKNKFIRKRLTGWIIDQYALFQVNLKSTDEAIDFLNHSSSKGFVIYFYKTQYHSREITFLFDYLKEQVLELNYKTEVSDRREYNRPSWVEKVERHFLKPRVDFSKEEKFNQQFGNILIELIFRNNKIYFLKFSATGYNDRAFKNVKEFSELIALVL